MLTGETVCSVGLDASVAGFSLLSGAAVFGDAVDSASALSDGTSLTGSKEDVLSYAEQQEDIVWITGGSFIYREFIPYCEELYRTVIEGNFQGDTYFPEIDWHDWKLVNSQSGIVDEKNRYFHRFERYQKNT